MELSTRKAAVTDALEVLNEKRPAGHHPGEILSMLDVVPDLRQTLKTAADDEPPKRKRPPRGAVAG